MTEDERRERINALAHIIDDFLNEDERFCLVVFSGQIPVDQEKVRFDVVANHPDREYVANVLQHVLDGVEESEGVVLPDMGERPN